MNIFSNIGITEIVVILLLALLVVGPERLPELGRKLGKTLRDLRRAYDNLTKDLGPELMSIQQTTQELRESVESITSIPKDTVQSVVKAAELEDTLADLKDVTGSLNEVGKTMASAGKMVRDPVGSAVSTARDALSPTDSAGSAELAEPTGSVKPATADDQTGAGEQADGQDLAAMDDVAAEALASREDSAKADMVEGVSEQGAGAEALEEHSDE
jgi:sec-independent protein translocase protein TatB